MSREESFRLPKVANAEASSKHPGHPLAQSLTMGVDNNRRRLLAQSQNDDLDEIN